MSSPIYHHTRRQDQRLVGFECQFCGGISFLYKKQTCKQCRDAPAEFAEMHLAERGTIESFVVQEYLPVVTYEDLGFCAGESGRFVEEGHPRLDGETPVNLLGRP